MPLTLKELNNHFHVPKWKLENGEYRLCSKTEHGRSVYKYLCNIYKKGTRWGVVGFEPTSKVEVLKKQVADYLSTLKYDSEYFDPIFRKGFKEEMFVVDFMEQIGFKKPGYPLMIDDTYYYEPTNIYGGKTTSIKMFFGGLDSFKGVNDMITINISTGASSWVSVKVKRDIEEIKQGIQELIKPLMITDGATLLADSEKIPFDGSLDYIKRNLDSLNINEENYKEVLKGKLLEMASRL